MTITDLDAVQFAQQTLDRFDEMTPEQREIFIKVLLRKYCDSCFYPHPQGRSCQCWNDE